MRNEAFDAKYIPEPNSGCWIWLRSLTRGYGHMKHNGKLVYAHRFSYEREFGKIPEGLVVDHLCKNTCCVNPAHIEPVTQIENAHRSGLRRTHCPKQHAYTPDNIYWSAKGYRVCKRCLLTAQKEKRHAKLRGT